MTDTLTFGRATLGASFVPNNLFLAFSFIAADVGIQFLKDVGLIPSSMVLYGSQISWRVDNSVKNVYRRQCRRAITDSACSAPTSIGYVSWFQQSYLNFAGGGVSLRTTSFANTKTIESIWRQMKAFINSYNWVGNHICHLAHYIFAAGCRSLNVNQFTHFIGIVASMAWSVTATLHPVNVTKWFTVVPLLVYSRRPQQVRSVTLHISISVALRLRNVR